MPTPSTPRPISLEELTDEIYEALSNAQDYNTTLTDFAKAVVRDVPLIADAVRAVNNHDTLRAALERIAHIAASDGDDFSAYPPGTIIRCEITTDDLRVIRAALATLAADGGDRE